MFVRGEKNKLAIVSSDGQNITYGGLDDLIKAYVKLNLQNRVVLVVADNSLSVVSSIVALIELGAIPVLFNCKSDDETLLRLIDTYNIPFLYGQANRFSSWSQATLVSSDIAGYGFFAFELGRASIIPSASLGVLLTTSGSTGSPKLVRISKLNLIANADAIAKYLSLTSAERPILHLPISYTYGLSVLTSHLFVGATIYCTDESIIGRRFWEFVKESECTSIPGVPYTYAMLKKLRFTQMDLPCLTTLTQAGGRLNAELQMEFGQWALENNKRFFVMYGQTEATARMSFLPPSRVLEKIGSIGIPIPGGSFELIDEDGAQIETANTVGQLIYQGPNVAMGYAFQESDLALPDAFNGKLMTGDLAYKDEDDYFFLVGRKDRYIKMYGNRVNLDDIEQMVLDFDVQAACVGQEDLITVFLFGDHLPTDMEIKKHLQQFTNFNTSSFRIANLDQAPLNLNGKLDYRKLVELSESL